GLNLRAGPARPRNQARRRVRRRGRRFRRGAGGTMHVPAARRAEAEMDRTSPGGGSDAMTRSLSTRWGGTPLFLRPLLGGGARAAAPRALSLFWDREMLTIRGEHLPGGELPVWYIEAFCRPGSTRRDWKQTVIPHRTRLVEAAPDGRRVRLRSEL